MGDVRVIAELTTKDPRAASELVQRVSDFVESTLPGTVAWESFEGPPGRWIWYEEFENEEALAAYEQAVSNEGMRDEARSIFELVRVTLLTPLADPQLKEMFNQIDAIEMRGVAGFNR